MFYSSSHSSCDKLSIHNMRRLQSSFLLLLLLLQYYYYYSTTTTNTMIYTVFHKIGTPLYSFYSFSKCRSILMKIISLCLLPICLTSYDVLLIDRLNFLRKQSETRKLSYRKDDRTMRPMYGCDHNTALCTKLHRAVK